MLDSARTLDILEQVAGALDAAHTAGLVHRDVKPRNVLVEDGDQAFLADFGLTRASDTHTATATGRFMATVAYAAPEVVVRRSGRSGGRPLRAGRGALRVPDRIDGLPAADYDRDPLRAHDGASTTCHRPARRGTARVDEVLMAGLAKDPERRPPTAIELIRRARTALGDVVLEPPAPRLVGRSERAGDTATSITAGPSVGRGAVAAWRFWRRPLPGCWLAQRPSR